MFIRSVKLLLILAIFAPYPCVMACDTVFRVVRENREDDQEIFARSVIEKAGCKIEIIKPVKGVVIDRRLVMIREGIIDLLVGVNKRPEREEYGYFSRPFRKEFVRIWAKKEDWDKYKDFDLATFSEKGIKLLGPSAGWYGPEFEAIRKASDKNLIQTTNIPHGLELLLRSRGDVLLGADNFESRFPDEVKERLVLLPPVLYEDTIHFMYSKKTVPIETVKIIDKVLVELLSEPVTSPVSKPD